MATSSQTKKVIEVIAPSSANITEKQIKRSTDYFTALGYQVRIPQNLFDFSCNIFHANSDEKRIKHTKNALLSEDTDIVWCLRGGYGAAKVIEGLIAENFKPKKEKVVIGFSDFTALNLYLYQRFGWKTIHGAGFSQAAHDQCDPKNITQVLELINNPQAQFTYQLTLINNKEFSEDILGTLSGGNLSILQTSLGTSWQLDGKDKILIIEDCNERGYRIDRMLNHLLHAGIFKEAKALICNFTGGDETDGKNFSMYALTNFSKQLSFPVFKIDTIGHGRVNQPFIYGRKAKIILNKNKYQLLF